MSEQQLKRTCDACVTSKTRCSGTLPCTRCEGRKIDCFFRARKKRAAPPPSSSSSPASSASSSAAAAAGGGHKQQKQGEQDGGKAFGVLRETAPWYLAQHERLSWLVFFTLYRNYRAGCNQLWFERQLARLFQRLQQEDKPELQQVFRQWLASLDIDFPEEITNKYLTCMEVLSDKTSFCSVLLHQGSLHLHVPGQVCASLPTEIAPQTSPKVSLEDMKKVFMSNLSSVPSVQMKCFGAFPHDQVEIEANEHFARVFGFNTSQLQRGSGIGSGLLPWGADLLCWVVSNEADVFAYVQMCALNFTWGVLSSFPCVRVVPSTHMLTVRLASGETVPCLIKCIHRETVDLINGVSTQLVMTFEPVYPPAAAVAAVLDEYLPMADGSHPVPAVDEEADFPYFGIDNVESDDVFLQDLLDFVRDPQ